MLKKKKKKRKEAILVCYPFLGFLFLGGRQTALYNQEIYKSNNRYIHTFESKKSLSWQQ